MQLEEQAAQVAELKFTAQLQQEELTVLAGKVIFFSASMQREPLLEATFANTNGCLIALGM